MKNITFLFISTVLLTASCQKDELVNSFPAKVSFDISQHLLEGKRINCIETTDDGKAWIGSGKELYFIDGNKQKLYTIEFNINDIAIGKDQTIWIGSDKGGLGHLAAILTNLRFMSITGKHGSALPKAISLKMLLHA